MTSARPVLIDERDGPCPYCLDWARAKFGSNGSRAHHCDECGAAIPNYAGMSGNGFESVVPHHYHLRTIHGGPYGRVGICQELCLECYVLHREKCFPPTEQGYYGQNHPSAEDMIARHEADQKQRN